MNELRKHKTIIETLDPKLSGVYAVTHRAKCSCGYEGPVHMVDTANDSFACVQASYEDMFIHEGEVEASVLESWFL